MSRVISVQLGTDLPALNKWLGWEIAQATLCRLVVERASVEPTHLTRIFTGGYEQEWVSAAEKPFGCMVLGDSRPGFAAILVATD